MTSCFVEVARYLGGGVKYKQVWDQMNRMNQHAKALKAAVDNGNDPMNVELNDTAAQGGKSKGKGNESRGFVWISFCQTSSTTSNNFQIPLTWRSHERSIWWGLHKECLGEQISSHQI